MNQTLFVQPAQQDPYSHYEKMLKYQPVYWEEESKRWVIFSYHDCKFILGSPLVRIPGINPSNRDHLNEHALVIQQKLARLSNGADHDIARQTAMFLITNMREIDIRRLFHALVLQAGRKEIDWIDVIGKRLPVILLLECFGFNQSDSDYVLNNIGKLGKIMLPVKTPEEIYAINETARAIYTIIRTQLLLNPFYRKLVESQMDKYSITEEEVLDCCISNLAGLFIQSYDAGKGLLGNSLLQMLRHSNNKPADVSWREHCKRSVIETLRFDPPVHTTRRIAADTILLGDSVIERDDSLLIVLAAANRDPKQFVHPSRYDIYRPNNEEHLTFGAAVHSCQGQYFAVNLVTECLAFLFEEYKKVRLIDEDIQYEKLTNARVPVQILISLK